MRMSAHWIEVIELKSQRAKGFCVVVDNAKFTRLALLNADVAQRIRPLARIAKSRSKLFPLTLAPTGWMTSCRSHGKSFHVVFNWLFLVIAG
jgi:hypothetical protein